VIAVAATDASDHRASFSNTGAWIDVSGPGVQVQSTYWDNTYASLSGTSMATPHVAGVAALILAVAPTTSAAQVANILRSTARALRDAPGDPVPNDRYGYGLVQAAAAVNMASPPIKSAQVICRSITVICNSRPCPSRGPLCQPSRVAICPSQLVSCHPSVLTCPSSPVTCRVRSVNAACPSMVCPSIVCASLACPSLACASGQCGGQPGVGAEADVEAYDPYGYDPYSNDYQ
jgi:hypothetical protein